MWIEKAPEGLPRIEQRQLMVKKPIQDVQEASAKVEKMAEGPADVKAVTVSLMNLGVGPRGSLKGTPRSHTGISDLRLTRD